jgi:hypothetical protein
MSKRMRMRKKERERVCVCVCVCVCMYNIYRVDLTRNCNSKRYLIADFSEAWILGNLSFYVVSITHAKHTIKLNPLIHSLLNGDIYGWYDKYDLIWFDSIRFDSIRLFLFLFWSFVFHYWTEYRNSWSRMDCSKSWRHCFD